METFLDKETLLNYNVDFKKFNLILTETYNETELAKSIDLIGTNICCVIAIQLAIIGYGNKIYNKVEFEGKIIDINEFFTKNNVKHDLSINAKLKPNDITPRRLIRFFRFSIQKYIEDNINIQSYLYKKYCLDKNDYKRNIVFPGNEHIIEPNIKGYKDAKILIDVYKFVDLRLNTKIENRIIRVLIARGFDINKLINDNNDIV